MFFSRFGCTSPMGSALIISALLLTAVVSSAAGEINDSIWAGLLEKYVDDGMVDYAGFQRDEEKLDRYLKELASIDPQQLSPNAQYAFFINVYNAWTIKLILSAYPDVKSIKELGSLFKTPWEKPIVELATGTFTLDDIEHKILRPKFKDPRIHFVVNCASISCPPLRSEPYTAKKLNSQLEDATRRFLNHPDSYRLEGALFYVSRIFKWYGEDFNNDALGFYLQYAEDDLKQKLQAAGEKLTVRYLEYDWGLNGS